MGATDQNPRKMIVETDLDDDFSDEHMDRLLAERHVEIETMLQQARDEQARGEIAPLEPLQTVLAEARRRLSDLR